MIDVVVFRGSDALYASVFDGLQALGLKISGIALCALPVALGWLVLSNRLGRAGTTCHRDRRGGDAVRVSMIDQRDAEVFGEEL